MSPIASYWAGAHATLGTELAHRQCFTNLLGNCSLQAKEMLVLCYIIRRIK